MSSPRLLVTSFNQNTYNMAEAAKAKAGALASSLLGTDRTDELWPSTPTDFFSSASHGGIDKVSYGSTQLFGLLGLTRGNRGGWERLHKNYAKEFPEWLAKQFAEPISCWYLSGHHHANDHYGAMSWGTQFRTTEGWYRPFAGVGVDRNTNVLEFFGYRSGSDVPREVQITAARGNLRSLSLFIIGGCNGIPRPDGSSMQYAMMADAWRDFLRKPDGSAPLILGWFNTHELPKDKLGDSAAALFWPEMKRLAQLHGADLAGLCTTHSGKVIEAWGQSCFTAYRNSVGWIGPKKVDQRHLWRIKWGTNDAKGAGAVAPNGDVYNANPAYTGSGGTAAMTKIGRIA